MISISHATLHDLPVIQEIAYKTWPDTYGAILSKAQLDYMLDKMYALETLTDNCINKGHQFILVKKNDTCLGFASFEHNYTNKQVTRLHKLYLLPHNQGKGIGKLLLDTVVQLAQEKHSLLVSLNVNKYNKAVSFYKNYGFKIIAEEDLEIGNGYLMEDYKMEKRI